MPSTMRWLSLAVLLASPPALPDDHGHDADDHDDDDGREHERERHRDRHEREGHPRVGADTGPDACVTCHSGRTPRIVKQWESSKHGLAAVKCFVCHGSVGNGFTEHPGAARCQDCHAAEVASVASPKRKPLGCFSCHAPHTLAPRRGAASPHGVR